MFATILYNNSINKGNVNHLNPTFTTRLFFANEQSKPIKNICNLKISANKMFPNIYKSLEPELIFLLVSIMYIVFKATS